MKQQLTKMGRIVPRKYFQSSSLLSRVAREIVKKGETHKKYNYTSSGTLKKFLKVFNNNSIRWAKKEAYLSNLRNCHSYFFTEIKGVVLGKVTKTFLKKSSSKLEPWLCISLILKNRPLDLYIPEDKIDLWYIGLSEFIKEGNPRAFCLTKGQYLWRKMMLVAKHVVRQKQIKDKLIKAKEANKPLTACQAFILFNKMFNINPEAVKR